MEEKIILKERIGTFIDALKEDYTVFAPVKRDLVVSFEKVGSAREMTLAFYNSKRVPKELFFPQSETLFCYTRGKSGETTLELPEPEKPTVLFGIRPCDARSLLLLDKVFDSPDFRDPYYLSKRQNTILIGTACNVPLSTCFCTSLGGSPFGKDGLDLLFIDLEDRYLVYLITEKGRELAKGFEEFQEGEEGDLKAGERKGKEAEDIISLKLKLEGITEKLEGIFDHPFWDEVHQKCLGCAICTYLCPTCHCFDIQDEAYNLRGERVRNWDSCMFPHFTLHASGHNPRPSGKQRMRQRIMHKFNYFPLNYGEIACVGCGRCVRECPVNQDVREVINQIAAF